MWIIEQMKSILTTHTKGDKEMVEKLFTHGEFAVAAIRKLRKGETVDGKHYYGIHTVYSGFNKAFQTYFGTNPVVALNKLAEEGVIVLRPAKGGYSMYLPEDKPKLITTESIIAKIVGDEA